MIDEWEGPSYGNRLVDTLNYRNPEDIEVIDQKKFNKRAINWVQQASFKVFGPFFAKHIINFKQHLMSHCPMNLMNYACFLFSVELLNGEITLYRSGKKPLIRHTTLRDSLNIQRAFNQLHTALDLVKLKNISKHKRKQIGKYTIEAQVFAQDFKSLCYQQLYQETGNINRAYTVQGTMITNNNISDGYNTMYEGHRDGNHNGFCRKHRFDPSKGYVSYDIPPNTIQSLPEIRIKDEHVVTKTNMNVERRTGQTPCQSVHYIRSGLMQIHGCSVCQQRTTTSTNDLCDRCQGLLDRINQVDDYNVLIALFNRSVPYAKYFHT